MKNAVFGGPLRLTHACRHTGSLWIKGITSSHSEPLSTEGAVRCALLKPI
jgi:hypothetical protein